LDLPAYFERVGFAGRTAPDLPTLAALHRAHLTAIAYENFDVQLGRPLTLDPAAAFEKLVRGRRGGWCYEMNGLFGAVLEAVGFKVTRLAGGVLMSALGKVVIGNHLVLKVELGDPWIADVGFGDGPLEPFPLRDGAFTAGGFDFRLERLADEGWRFHNHAFGGAPNFDFSSEAADPAQLTAQCDWLQTSPQSPFRLNATAQRHRPGEVLVLRGRLLRRVRRDGFEERLIGSADELVEVLDREFDLDIPEAAALWPRILARHAELFAPA